MSRTIRTVGLFATAFVLVSFSLLVLNQTAQAVQLATAVDPTLGRFTLWALVAVYATTLGVPAFLFLRMPGPLVPPIRDEGPEFDAHLARMARRIGGSPLLAGRDLADRRGVEQALLVLDAKADAIVREAASAVFLSTAVSQSGRLDGLLVLSAQSRMIWRVARLYAQRPSPRDMARLYANVAGTAFLAGELQDIDLADQVEPILAATVGSLGGNVPGLKVAGTILANCLLSGSSNAFLTLRVGMIAKRSCAAMVVEPRPALRRAATAEAAKLLGGVVAEGSRKVSAAFWKAATGRLADACQGTADFAKDAGSKVMSWSRLRGARPQPDVG